MRRPFIVAAVACLSLATGVAWAGVITPVEIIGTKALEEAGDRGPSHLAWSANTVKKPNHSNVYARPNGGERVRVNARKTQAFMGSIHGNRLAYQQARPGDFVSDIKFYNLVTENRSNPPVGVNTKHWEYWPSVSDDHLLFARYWEDGHQKVILLELDTGVKTVLGKMKASGAARRGENSLGPGEVTGGYAVWERTRVSRESCEVFRYDIATGETIQIPAGNECQYHPSVTSDGTVYYAESSFACGEDAVLKRWTLATGSEDLFEAALGSDIGRTRTFEDSTGGASVLFSYGECTSADWDLFEAAV